jgi:tripartite-type tricarboxylate transporter receptor subunit TctC
MNNNVRETVMARIATGLARGLCAALAVFTCAALAQSYPAKPLRWIVPYAPGGGTDTITRAIAPHLQASLGQPVVIENRPSASGFIGLEAVAKSAPDGYTLLTAGNELALLKHLYRSLTFDPVQDLMPVCIMVTVPIALFVHESVPAKTLKELVAYAKTNPKKLNFGSPGVGHGFHLAMEMFLHDTGTEMTHVPYKGSALVMQDLFSGRIQATMYPPNSQYVGQVKAGGLRALAAGASQRLAALPDVPTFQEAGLAGFNADGFNVVAVRNGTPRDIQDRLNREIQRILATPELGKAMAALSVLPAPLTAPQSQEFVAKQLESWGKVVKAIGLQLD